MPAAREITGWDSSPGSACAAYYQANSTVSGPGCALQCSLSVGSPEGITQGLLIPAVLRGE